SQNLFILKTVNPKKPYENDITVINEFEGFSDYVENELAMKIFGHAEDSKKERIRYARNLLIKMIGKEEFIRLKQFFDKDNDFFNKNISLLSLDETELTLFKLIARGFNQAEIAELLSWNLGKVKYHKRKICEKMNFAKISDLVDYANKNRLI
ncbi:MAG: hypothetical protein JXA16_02430, partial [Bacteroidales bacterium]|nr:hypothetical protein [Bacteroidales bacterium]